MQPLNFPDSAHHDRYPGMVARAKMRCAGALSIGTPSQKRDAI